MVHTMRVADLERAAQIVMDGSTETEKSNAKQEIGRICASIFETEGRKELLDTAKAVRPDLGKTIETELDYWLMGQK